MNSEASCRCTLIKLVIYDKNRTNAHDKAHIVDELFLAFRARMKELTDAMSVSMCSPLTENQCALFVVIKTDTKAPLDKNGSHS